MKWAGYWCIPWHQYMFGFTDATNANAAGKQETFVISEREEPLKCISAFPLSVAVQLNCRWKTKLTFNLVYMSYITWQCCSFIIILVAVPVKWRLAQCLPDEKSQFKAAILVGFMYSKPCGLKLHFNFEEVGLQWDPLENDQAGTCHNNKLYPRCHVGVVVPLWP